MSYPYGLMADIHLHNWSAFSETNASGVNGRLQTLLNEIQRAANEVAARGGNTLVIAGDVFHVRGSLAPTVLNPTMSLFATLVEQGFQVVILAGNHDLERKESEQVSSAITALKGVGCHVVNRILKHGDLLLVPWIQNVEQLKSVIIKAASDIEDKANVDLIIHAPIDGVISGLPDHGLTDTWFTGLGFRRTFAGHYHHHRDFGNGTYSIGALAHHTWSDIGSKAGFLLVDEDSVEWRASHAPSFVEIDADIDPSEIELVADGNYVRAKVKAMKQSEIEDAKQFLMDCGAKGVVVLCEKDATPTKRTGATVKTGATLEESVGAFIKAQGYKNSEKLNALCASILSEARA